MQVLNANYRRFSTIIIFCFYKRRVIIASSAKTFLIDLSGEEIYTSISVQFNLDGPRFTQKSNYKFNLEYTFYCFPQNNALVLALSAYGEFLEFWKIFVGISLLRSGSVLVFFA